ncbi:MAG: tyrosine-type recombinase/integrase, partial [Fibrobacteres bacterium]|nr:tyrosine-type recombinase/integrase [Fibrobacterota bacterium]
MKTTKKGIYWRNGNLVIDHFVEGVRIYRTLDGNTNMKLAERVLAKMVNEVVEGTYFPGKSKSSLTVWDVLKDYKDQKIDPKIRRYEAEGLVRKVRQLKNLKYPMNQLADYFGKMPVHELNHSVLEVRKEKRMSERTRTGKLVGGRSVNVEFGLLNRALNWAVKATKKLRENPIKGFVKAEENEPSKRAFAEDEWLRFYDALSPRHKDLFLVIYESGARPSEILDLERGWVDLFKRQIHLPARITKTLKSRSIPMSDEL